MRLVEHLLCSKCGYDLFGSLDPPLRCPECGEQHSVESLRAFARRKPPLPVGVIIFGAAVAAVTGLAYRYPIAGYSYLAPWGAFCVVGCLLAARYPRHHANLFWLLQGTHFLAHGIVTTVALSPIGGKFALVPCFLQLFLAAFFLLLTFGSARIGLLIARR